MKVTLAGLSRMRRQHERDLVAKGMPPDQAKLFAWRTFAEFDVIEVDEQGRQWIDIPDDDGSDRDHDDSHSRGRVKR